MQAAAIPPVRVPSRAPRRLSGPCGSALRDCAVHVHIHLAPLTCPLVWPTAHCECHFTVRRSTAGSRQQMVRDTHPVRANSHIVAHRYPSFAPRRHRVRTCARRRHGCWTGCVPRQPRFLHQWLLSCHRRNSRSAAAVCPFIKWQDSIRDSDSHARRRCTRAATVTEQNPDDVCTLDGVIHCGCWEWVAPRHKTNDNLNESRRQTHDGGGLCEACLEAVWPPAFE